MSDEKISCSRLIKCHWSNMLNFPLLRFYFAFFCYARPRENYICRQLAPECTCTLQNAANFNDSIYDDEWHTSKSNRKWAISVFLFFLFFLLLSLVPFAHTSLSIVREKSVNVSEKSHRKRSERECAWLLCHCKCQFARTKERRIVFNVINIVSPAYCQHLVAPQQQQRRELKIKRFYFVLLVF